MNFGSKSKDLLVELKRSDWLPPYNEDGVRGVLAEIQALYDELTDTLGGRTTVSRACLRPPATYSVGLAICVWSFLVSSLQRFCTQSRHEHDPHFFSLSVARPE